MVFHALWHSNGWFHNRSRQVYGGEKKQAQKQDGLGLHVGVPDASQKQGSPSGPRFWQPFLSPPTVIRIN